MDEQAGIWVIKTLIRIKESQIPGNPGSQLEAKLGICTADSQGFIWSGNGFIQGKGQEKHLQQDREFSAGFQGTDE